MSVQKTGQLTKRFFVDDFNKIIAEFSAWRMDEHIKLLNKMQQKGWGNVLPFVRGLRLSAQLIYVIRKYLNGTNLTADWGHLMYGEEEEEYLTPECDIIIYDKQGKIGEWNDKTDKAVMNFKFVQSKSAKLIISCKSFLKSSDIDKEYCKEIKKYVDKIWLFAECCGPRSPLKIEEKAKEIGYEKFFYLYTWSKSLGADPNEEGWLEFIRSIRKDFNN